MPANPRYRGRLWLPQVAQGIETRADFFAVREMDFDMVQGFLFAKPMTAQKFALTSLRKPVTIPE